ncbi:hypothetical protein [Nocardia xishanensis]
MSSPQTDSERLARQRILGWGWRCDPIFPGVDLGRDLRLRSGPAGVDLDVVVGVDCLAQDLSVALTTLRGSDVLNTTFGFDGLAALAEETAPVLVRERLRVAVAAVVARDSRVRRVIDVEFEDTRLGAPQPGSRELGIRVTFETLTNDRVTIDLGRLTSGA